VGYIKLHKNEVCKFARYNAPKAWLQKLGIGNARIYFSGTNLLTWAAYDQYDPEMSGVVGFYTPPLKTYAFGLELKF